MPLAERTYRAWKRAQPSDRDRADRNDAGNIDYEAPEVDGEPGAFVIYERWETRERLNAHLSPSACRTSRHRCSISSRDPSKMA
ncbi:MULTISPECIES: putative quinol monooxygenase [Bacteria]